MRVALVHEWLVNIRGSEHVLLRLARLFPDAAIFVSVLKPSALPEELSSRDVRTTFIQKLPRASSLYQTYLPLMPLAFESLDLQDYDLVISSSHACAKGVITAPQAKHICYCHTPMRYAWSEYHRYRQHTRGPIRRFASTLLLHYLRLWDVSSSARVDHFIANSSEVAARIARYYGRSAEIIPPPVERIVQAETDSAVETRPLLLPRFFDANPFYLFLGRLVPYKRLDLAVAACERLGAPLVVAGDGSRMDEPRHGNSATERGTGRAEQTAYLGPVTDAEARWLFAHCQAFLFPGLEDFGITMVEALSFGKPVVAYARGGALDIIRDGRNGVLFREPTAKALAEAMERLQQITFDPDEIKSSALAFHPDYFDERVRSAVSRVLTEQS